MRSPPQSDNEGEEGEVCEEEGVPDVPMEQNSSDSGAVGDAARPVAGTSKKRRCLGSADVLNEVVEREIAQLSLRFQFCLLSRLRSPKIWKKEPFRFFVWKRRRMKGTLCFWDRKGDSSDKEWVLVKKKERRNNVF